LVVQADGLLRHATALESLAATVREARAAGAQTRLDRSAYGRLPAGQLIVGLIDPVQRFGVEALAAAVDALHGTADAVRAAAHGYSGSDERVHKTFAGGPR
jgi:hypothetical protein